MQLAKRARMRRTTRKAASALALCTGVGCTVQLGTEQEHLGHDTDEVHVSQADASSWRRDGDWLVSPVLDVPDGASRVGALIGTIEPGEAPAIEAQAMRDGEPIGEWTALRVTWSEEDTHVAVADFVEVAGGARIRIAASTTERLTHLRWNAVIPQPGEGAGDDEIGRASQALRSELLDLGVVTRSGWGARSTRCSSRNTAKHRMAIHHTVTHATDPARQLRGIQRYHMDSRGWCDVGYHFLIGVDGRIYEGRPLELLGSHVGGHNTGNIGISFIGCFGSSGCGSLSGSGRPNEASIDAAATLVRRLSDIHGISITSSNVKGHRDHTRQGTSCPGSYLHARLDDIRSRARGGTGSAPPAPSEPDSSSPPPGPSCSVNGRAGTCEDISRCTGDDVATTGYCPGPREIQCCTPPPSCSVGGRAGVCIDRSRCTGDRSPTPGYCSGPTNIQCCT